MTETAAPEAKPKAVPVPEAKPGAKPELKPTPGDKVELPPGKGTFHQFFLTLCGLSCYLVQKLFICLYLLLQLSSFH